MQKLKKILLMLIFIALTIGCKNHEQIHDIITPIKLVAGQTDSVVISDLFYAPNYNLNFKTNKDFKLKFENNKLFLTADSSFEGLTLLEFEADMNLYQIPIISKKEIFYEFQFKPDKQYEQITLFGSFNGWNRTDLPMTDENGDGVYSAKVSLEPGIYQYKFFGDGEEIVDPKNPEKVSNGMGSFNSIRTIEDENIEKIFLHKNDFEKNENELILKFMLEYGKNANVNKEDIYALLNNSKIQDDNLIIKGNNINVKLNLSDLEGKNTFRIAVSKNGQISNFQNVELYNGKPVKNDSFSWKDGIIYSLMIDRFSDGDSLNNNPVAHDSLSPKANYMGGDFEGIIDKLTEGYFDSLGINVLWISPVYDNPDEAYKEYPAPHRYYSGYHGYWPISSTKVESRFGTMDQLKEIVSLAHSKGIKVLLDFVSNHVHEQHPFYQQHRDWFGQLHLPDGRLNLRFWDEFRLTTWFEPYLPSFDYLGSQAALDTMTSNAVWWLLETGADGFRHDAVKHVPNEFWRKLNEKLKIQVSSKRDLEVYQIGETFGSYELISSYVNNGQLNAQFNFNLYDVALPTFINPTSSFSGLDKEMHKTFSVYGENHLMGNVMDSHDKNRFMAFADGDLDASTWSAIEEGWNNPPVVDDPENYKKLILYMAFMNSIPGLPVIYYGSEFGMSGASDPDNRRMMRFNSDLSVHEKTTLNEVSKIINLRKEHSALRHGDFYTLQADKNIYAYIRSDFNERILIIINKNLKQENIELKIPEYYKTKNLLDLSNNTKQDVVNNLLKLELPKFSWKMYELN